MSKRKITKFIRTFDPPRIYEFGEYQGNDYKHVYELSCSPDGKNTGAVWHRVFKSAGDVLIVKWFYVDGIAHEFQLVPTRVHDRWRPDWSIKTLPDKDSDKKAEYVPESWASNYFGGYINGEVKIGDKLVRFLLELNETMTAISPIMAWQGKYGAPNKRPGWKVFILNDAIKDRVGFDKELKKVEEE